MTNTTLLRPQWLRTLLLVFSAWTYFALATIALLGILFGIIEMMSQDAIEGTAAVVALIAIGVMSIFLAYKGAKWQHNYLEKKSMRRNYITLIFQILFSLITMPIFILYLLS